MSFFRAGVNFSKGDGSAKSGNKSDQSRSTYSTLSTRSGVYSIKGCNGEEGVLITCPPPPRPVVTKMTQMEWKTIDDWHRWDIGLYCLISYLYYLSMVFHSIWVISVTTGLGGGGQVIGTAPWKCYPYRSTPAAQCTAVCCCSGQYCVGRKECESV